MQWNKTPVQFLKPLLSQSQTLEQTQELRIPEGMPEIGKILGAWGQCILRGKEWRADAFSVSGGIQSWVLYAPEDGSDTQFVREWIPFQAKWNMPQTRREAAVAVTCCMQSMDARAASPRKILLRANVGLSAEGMEPDSQLVYCPEEEDKDVQYLKKTYPAVIPKEAGEKRIAVEETLSFAWPGARILGWDTEPVLEEQTVLGNKAVFKGNCRLHLVFQTESGEIAGETFDIPFAQYADLEAEYDKEASVSACLCLSELEPELTETGLTVRCGIMAQYTVQEPVLLQMAQDAYSPYMQVETEMQTLTLPMLLDSRTEERLAQVSAQTDMEKISHVCFCPGLCTVWRQGSTVNGDLSGVFRILGTDGEGNPICQTEAWQDTVTFDADPACSIRLQMQSPQQAEGTLASNRLQLSAPVTVRAKTERNQTLPMLTDCRVGEAVVPDPQRPSLIVKRQEEESLWELAKQFGSTVEAICRANNLDADPVPGQLLLIPVC